MSWSTSVSGSFTELVAVLDIVVFVRVLVVGGSGLLGAELCRHLVHSGAAATGTFANGSPADVPGVEWFRLNVTDPLNTVTAIRGNAPDVIINTAYRADDWATTADGAANVALAARDIGARLVFVSSDAVFSGTSSPYTEDAAPDPVTAYGAAKAAAETAVRAITPDALIGRTSLIISSTGVSLHEQRTHAAVSGDGALFVDDIRCPVHVGDLAAALLELAGSAATGVRHLAGADAVSRYELGRLIAQRDGLDPDHIRTAYRADGPNPGPLDVRLDSTVTQGEVTTRLRGAHEFLNQTPTRT